MLLQIGENANVALARSTHFENLQIEALQESTRKSTNLPTTLDISKFLMSYCCF